MTTTAQTTPEFQPADEATYREMTDEERRADTLRYWEGEAQAAQQKGKPDRYAEKMALLCRTFGHVR